jgi:alkaline phosphatase D
MLDLSRIPDAVRSEGGVSRRLFLAYGSALAALPALALRTRAADAKPKFDANPFSLGVASGDPDSTSVVLWTRLAPKSLEADGGMKPETVAVASLVSTQLLGRGTTPRMISASRRSTRGCNARTWPW